MFSSVPYPSNDGTPLRFRQAAIAVRYGDDTTWVGATHAQHVNCSNLASGAGQAPAAG